MQSFCSTGVAGELSPQSRLAAVFLAQQPLALCTCQLFTTISLVNFGATCGSAGAWLKEWRRRYFRLIGNKLYFSKEPTVSGSDTGVRSCSCYIAWACLTLPIGCRPPSPFVTISLLQDEPHGVIDLKDCLTVKSAEDKTGKAHSFEVATPEQTYYMFAGDETSKDEWIGAIGKAIVRYSHSYRPDEADDDDDDEDDD